MQKFIIPTLQKENIIAQLLTPKQDALGLVFILHGLAGFKEEDYLLKCADIFLNKGLAVCLYDARHSFGESDGNLKNACFSNFIQDFEVILNWAKKQNFYQEPFFALGHSLGAGAVLFQAIKEPSLFKGIICLAPVYNGNKLLDSYKKTKPDFVLKWKQEKYLYKEKEKNPHVNGYISFDHIHDAQKYQLETLAQHITCPTLIIAGDRDISSTKEINEDLFSKLKSDKELHIIKNGTHTFRSDENKKELEIILNNWLSQKFK